MTSSSALGDLWLYVLIIGEQMYYNAWTSRLGTSRRVRTAPRAMPTGVLRKSWLGFMLDRTHLRAMELVAEDTRSFGTWKRANPHLDRYSHYRSKHRRSL